MRHGSLFSGIGGFDLAAEWMGWENVFHCEWNKFGQQVLKHYWPQSKSYDDIKKTDFTIHRGQIDILTGGFPCQPYSAAGKRLGKEDERHLWPEMLRAIREIQPRYVVGENVRGLTNWNGGVVFDEVQADLEAEGYEVLPFLLPACAVNAPHRRDRIWFVAYAERAARATGNDRREKHQYDDGKSIRIIDSTSGKTTPDTTRSSSKGQHIERQGEGKLGRCDCKDDASNPNLRRQPGKEHRQAKSGWIAETSGTNDWTNFPTQSAIRSGNDGIPSRLDGITFPKWRNESIKAGGNAIVPQVALQIFRAIELMEQKQLSE